MTIYEIYLDIMFDMRITTYVYTASIVSADIP